MSHPTVLVTGSSGFLGDAIIRGLTKRYHVIGLDVAKPKKPVPGVETIEIDLTSDTSVAAALAEVRARSGGRVASVIHLAAYYDTIGEDNPKYAAVTVEGTRRLLAALKGLETEQFVFSSTLLVHAPSPAKGKRITEASPLDPTWAYPKSKAETEALILEEHGDIKIAIMRLAGVYDEDCRAAFIAQQIARIFERMPTAYLFADDITSGQPYLHKDDLVDAVIPRSNGSRTGAHRNPIRSPRPELSLRPGLACRSGSAANPARRLPAAETGVSADPASDTTKHGVRHSRKMKKSSYDSVLQPRQFRKAVRRSPIWSKALRKEFLWLRRGWYQTTVELHVAEWQEQVNWKRLQLHVAH